jgi:hypothetical protein
MQDADKLSGSGKASLSTQTHAEEGLNPMTRRIAATIARAVRTMPAHEDVHFHLGSDGRPFVCDFHRCESPELSPSEVGVALS